MFFEMQNPTNVRPRGSDLKSQACCNCAPESDFRMSGTPPAIVFIVSRFAICPDISALGMFLHMVVQGSLSLQPSSGNKECWRQLRSVCALAPHSPSAFGDGCAFHSSPAGPDLQTVHCDPIVVVVLMASSLRETPSSKVDSPPPHLIGFPEGRCRLDPRKSAFEKTSRCSGGLPGAAQ